MSYPQPKASVYSANGAEFFPLNTQLSSPGDIYESDVSGHGFAVGPTSDIANVAIAYFDAQAPNNMQTIEIGPDRPFVGRVDANNSSQYQPPQRPGRILMWAANLYDPNFKPRAFVPATDTIQFVPPLLSVTQYFASQASLVSSRVDKFWLFQNYNIVGGTGYLVLPYYGRKYCRIQFTNRNAVTPNTYGIIGVNYAITQDDTANPYTQETAIRAPAAVASGVSVTTVITAASTGMFDALVFSLTDAGPAPLNIVMSDTTGV